MIQAVLLMICCIQITLSNIVEEVCQQHLQGMTRIPEQDSDHRSKMQQLPSCPESLSKHNAELERALNTANSDVALRDRDIMQLAHHILACAPDECAALFAVQQAQVWWKMS